MKARPYASHTPAGGESSPTARMAARSAVANGVPMPWMTVLIIAAAIFVGEALIMFVLPRTHTASPYLELIDALLVAVLCLVLLQRFVLGPLQREVDERRSVEAELRIQTAALHATAHGVIITDRSGRILWANPAFTAMTGYTLGEVLGRTPRVLQSGQHDVALYSQMWETIVAGDVWQGELTNRRKDGTLYTEEQTITPVRDEVGRVAYFIAIMSDCTQRKEAELQLARHNQALQALSQAERHQRQFAEALIQATHALNTSLVLDEVLDRILEQTQAMVPCRAVAVMLLRGDWVEVVRHRDVSGTARVFAEGFPLDLFPDLRAIATHQMPRLIEDTLIEQTWAGVQGLAWIRSVGVAPLIEDHRVSGFLSVVSEQPAYFDQEALACLMAFASHAAVALQNARLYRAELYARQTAETLSAASLDLTRTLHLQAVFDSLLRHLHQLVDYDGAHVALRDGDGAMSVRAAVGVDPWADAERAPAALDVEACPTLQSLVYEQQSLIVTDPRAADRSPYFATLGPVRSWLGVPIVVGDHTVGFCGLVKDAPDFFTAEHARLTAVMVAQAAVAIQNARLFQQVQSGHERLQALSRRLVQVQEHERLHVARELHDEASQALTSLKYGLRRLEQTAASPETMMGAVAELCDVTDAVMENLHRLAMDLRPASLDLLGLVVALRDHVAKYTRQHGLQGRVEALGFGETRLPAELEIALYRIAQEALTNVVRHAHATQVDLLLNLTADTVRMTVEDDGVGFETAALVSPGQMGLLGMRERCEMLGGQFSLESTPGGGTTLVVELPLHDADSDCR